VHVEKQTDRQTDAGNNPTPLLPSALVKMSESTSAKITERQAV